MRIISGKLGGRRFSAPSTLPARPTTDLAREGLFNILNNLLSFEEIIAVDLFAGTGSVGYELLSRGAQQVQFVEQHAASVAFIKKTIQEFDLSDAAAVVRTDVFQFLRKTPEEFPFIFADPPYALPNIPELCTLMITRLNETGLAVIEHDQRNFFDKHPHFLREKKYGDTIFSFFTKQQRHE
ncbi:MAG: RsmD family RNA methyltransferase [Bacteroidetes bacterium]|nr:RsmD family RNA methyltransferase [Bacteroidota bacterium]